MHLPSPSHRFEASPASAQPRYEDQFTVISDPLEILIPRPEIFAAMLARGEEQVLDEVCLAVAVCADAISAAITD